MAPRELRRRYRRIPRVDAEIGGLHALGIEGVDGRSGRERICGTCGSTPNDHCGCHKRHLKARVIRGRLIRNACDVSYPIYIIPVVFLALLALERFFPLRKPKSRFATRLVVSAVVSAL